MGLCSLSTNTAVVQSVRSMAAHYHPFGTYHFIIGASVRTPQHGREPAQGKITLSYSLSIHATELQYL